LIHCKNFCKCHNVLPLSTMIKNIKKRLTFEKYFELYFHMWDYIPVLSTNELLFSIMRIIRHGVLNKCSLSMYSILHHVYLIPALPHGTGFILYTFQKLGNWGINQSLWYRSQGQSVVDTKLWFLAIRSRIQDHWFF
jgi:hypothetical protein